jgi:ornithine carbamoyltransferase
MAEAFFPYQRNNSLAGRDYLRMLDLSPDQLQLIIQTARAEKTRFAADPAAALKSVACQGQAVAVILEKPSLRTRVSFERAIYRLGAQAIVLSDDSSAFSRGESIKDTMMVLERYVNAVVIRTFGHDRIEEAANWADIPVINALTNDFHPCQGLADLMTIEEHFGQLSGLKLAYLGDGANNMAHTYLEAAALAGMHAVIASPAAYQPMDNYLAEAREVGRQTGARLEITESPESALEGANVVVTDSWASMGFEDEHAQRVEVFTPYQVTAQSMRLAAPDAVFMHCLPAHRGEEVTNEVMDADYSLIYQEAENRMHVQQALLGLLLAG